MRNPFRKSLGSRISRGIRRAARSKRVQQRVVRGVAFAAITALFVAVRRHFSTEVVEPVTGPDGQSPRRRWHWSVRSTRSVTPPN